MVSKNERTQSDHDLLITLDVKLDALTKEMRISNDGTKERLSSVENRTDKIEAMIERVSPDNTFREFQTLKQEVHDFKTSANLLRIIGGILGGFVFFLLTQLPTILRGWGIIH